MKIKYLLLQTVIVLFFVSCKKENSDTGLKSVDFSGTWEGTWESTSNNISGTFTASITQKENVLSGTISIPEIAMEGTTLKGNVNGKNISFGDINGIITFTGKMNTDSTLSGSYYYKAYNDKGTWQTKVSTPVVSTMYPSDTITTNLTSIWLKGVAFDGTSFFAISDNNIIYKISTGGQIEDSLTSPVKYPIGLTYDGSHLLLADDPGFGTGIIFKLNGFEKIALNTPGHGDMMGSVVIGNNLWLLDDLGQKIYKQSIENGSILDSISINTNFNNGLAYDGENFWYSSMSKIIKIDIQGNTLREFDYPGSWVGGLTFMQNYLWIIDNSNYKIYKTDTALNVVSTIDAPTTFSSNITNDGDNLWLVKSGVAIYYTQAIKINTNGDILSTIDLPYDRSQVGALAYANNKLWYSVMVQKTTFEVDASGSSCFKFPQLFSHLTWDGMNLWGYNSDLGEIIQFSTAGTLIQSDQLSVDSPTGMTWDGTNLWILSDTHTGMLKLEKLDAAGSIIKTIEVYRPSVTIHHSYPISTYGIVYANNAFWIFGCGPFNDPIKIYKYPL